METENKRLGTISRRRKEEHRNKISERRCRKAGVGGETCLWDIPHKAETS
jgi:hypothetical protein